jgi:hypothetical protein
LLLNTAERTEKLVLQIVLMSRNITDGKFVPLGQIVAGETVDPEVGLFVKLVCENPKSRSL